MRSEIIKKLKPYFDIRELVGPETYNKLGNQAWQVFDTDTLHSLLLMRVGIDKPFTVNTWHKGGEFSQRGFRDNTQQILKDKTIKGKLYLSGHVMGKAIDFVVSGMDSEDVRQWIINNAEIFRCKIRLEHKKNGEPISWVHFDTKHDQTKPKIYLFNV